MVQCGEDAAWRLYRKSASVSIFDLQGARYRVQSAKLYLIIHLLQNTMPAVSPYRVLFVCLGNICRSPAAEIIFNAVAEKAGVSHLFRVDSCGTASYHTGSRPDSRMIAALERAGYRYGGHRARTFRRADFTDFDLIIPQDHSNEEDILCLARHAEDAARVRGMWNWFAENETETSVPDPYYGGPAGFDAVVALLTRSAENLLRELQSKLS